MENDIQKRYPMTYAVLRNAADRITKWRNVTKQAKTRKRMEIANIVIALSNTF